MSRIYTCARYLSPLIRSTERKSQIVTLLPSVFRVCRANSIPGYNQIYRTLHTSFSKYNNDGSKHPSDSPIPYNDKVKAKLEELLSEQREGVSETRQNRYWKDGVAEADFQNDEEFTPRRQRRIVDDEDFDDTPSRSSYPRRNFNDRQREGGSRFGRREAQSSMFDDDYSLENIQRQRRNNYDEFLNSDQQNSTSIEEEDVELPALEKNFFNPTDSLLSRSNEEVSEYLKSNNIIMKGNASPAPILQFTDHHFPERVQTLLQEFDAPTAIQAQGWSVALSGNDLIGIGQTGSGKTLGYLLPGLMHVRHQFDALQSARLDRQDSPIGLVVAPTRELVQQIQRVFHKYGPAYHMKCVAMFGGASRNRQLEMLRQNPKFIIATPGRLIDFLMEGSVRLDRCSYVVLDEADRMLDMGFEPQIRNIMEKTRADRQTLMWSATWPDEVQELAGEFLTDPIQLSVGSTELRANPDIKQHVFVCDHREKTSMLIDLLSTMLENNSANQAIVFCSTKRVVDQVTTRLYKRDISAQAIHGDKTQAFRDRTLNGFRRKNFSVLVATEVAARGLDIPVLKCVVNYDFPNDVESYVHRIGRTGRSGNRGLAYTFFTLEDAPRAKALMKVLSDADQQVPDDLQNLAERHVAGVIKNKAFKRRNNNNNFYGRGGPSYGRNSRW